MSTGTSGHDFGIDVIVLLVAVLATMGGILNGPALGDHEAIVAQCARNMRVSGDWVVPRYRESTFLRKPPLGYWLVAASSYLFEDDPATGLPVSETAARFPSAAAALGTVLLLWKLGSRMFGRRVGRVTAVVASSSLLILLFAPNATVEMILTFCCTWAFAHFWFAYVNGYRTPRGLLHLLMFYIALGVGMLAKGPAPLAMVAVPLAIWWYSDTAFRALSRRSKHNLRDAGLIFLRNVPRQTARAFTSLWVVPGVLIFLAVFVPWMLAAAKHNTQAFTMWNWQYLQRFQGDYEDTKVRGALYYVPISLGLLAPWTLSLFEGLARLRIRPVFGRRSALFLAATWGIVGIAIMSAMTFKKPYYVLPAIPGLILITSLGVDRFFSSRSKDRRLGIAILILMAIGIAAGLTWAWRHLHEYVPTMQWPLMMVAIACGLLVLASGFLHVIHRGGGSMAALAAAMIGGFLTVWNVAGDALDNVDAVAALDRQLDEAGVPADAIVYWADQRPDARLEFYFGRRSAHLVDPSELVTRWVDRTSAEAKRAIAETVVERVKTMLSKPETVYVLLNRRHLPWLEHAPSVTATGRTLCTIDVDNHPDKHDWIVLTNSRT